MSRYWGYRCKQDGAESNQWFNHGEDILRSCAKCYPYIQHIQHLDTSGSIEVTIMGGAYPHHEVWNFLDEHFEHGVELYNEYGESEPLDEESQG